MPIKLSDDLESLIQRKQKDIEVNKYEKYIELFNIAIKFLKKQEKVLLYGGTAINSIMPTRYKFYRATELPDLDLFSTRAIGLANDLVREFKRKGYELSTVQEALHIGTYKVLVNGVTITDISHVSPSVFTRLQKDSIVGDLGLPVCNPEFLRSTLYVLLSQPQDSHRWSKVIERLITFNTVFPPKIKVALHYLKIDMKTALPIPPIEAIVRTFANKHNLIWTGEPMLKEILKIEPKWYKKLESVSSPIPYILLVQDNANQMAHAFAKQHPELKLKVGHSMEEEEFIQKHTSLTYQGRPILTFIQLNNCLSYTHFKDSNIASFSTLLRLLYEFYFNSQDEAYLAWIHLLIGIGIKHYSSKLKLLQVVNTDCEGPAVGLFTLRRERFERMVEKNKIQYKS